MHVYKYLKLLYFLYNNYNWWGNIMEKVLHPTSSKNRDEILKNNLNMKEAFE